MNKLRVKAIGIPLLIVAVLLPAGAAADTAPGTSIESLSATVGATTVSVSGNGTFTAPPVEIGVDGTNDHTINQAPLPTGTDLTIAKIQALNPTTLRFELEVADMSAAGGTPEAITYLWPFLAGGSEYSLQAHRTATASEMLAVRPQNVGNPTYSLNTCAPDPTTGTNSCTRRLVTGEFTGHSVVWLVPSTMLALNPLSPTLHEGSAIVSSLSFSGALWLNNGTAGDTMFAERPFTFPTATVLGTIVPATVADEDAVPATPLMVHGSGAFSGALAAPAEPGAYKVVVRACFGAGNCAVASTPITVAP